MKDYQVGDTMSVFHPKRNAWVDARILHIPQATHNINGQHFSNQVWIFSVPTEDGTGQENFGISTNNPEIKEYHPEGGTDGN